MYNKKSKSLKFIACLLVFTLLFTSIPLNGFVALAEQAIEDSKLITVVKELDEYRTEFSKTYLKSDGTLEAVVSANAIHFKDGNKWAEIDSTLETARNEKGEEILKNKKGPFDVELPTEIQSNSEIAIKNGEHKISIKLLETKKSKGKKNNDKKQKAEELTKTQRKNMTAGELFEVDNNQNSAIEYSAVYNDTNIRYDVTPTEVKESIVLTKAPNKKATYSYEITADGLNAVLNEDNSIDFYKKGEENKGSPVFSMPAPHMFDSNDEYSYNIETTLKNKNGKFILIYKPNYEWLKSKDRVYPVTIDPTVTVNSGIQDSYTFSGEGYGDSYTGYEQQLKVGTTAWIAQGDYWQTYLKFTDLPQIPYEDYRIDSAYLTLSPKATTGSWQEMELGVYELTEDWKNHQTGKVAERITFNNAPADVGYSTATATVSRSNVDIGVDVGFEIAHLVKKWYDSPETNFGIKLAAHLEQSQWNDNLVFHSSRSTTGTAPYLTLTYTEYVPVTGVEITNRPANDKIEIGYYAPAYALNATVYPENATNKNVIWESSNDNVGEIDEGGMFTPFAVGTTTITARSADNNEIFDSFVLEVYNIPIEEIVIIDVPDSIMVGTTYYANLIAQPFEATDYSIFIDNYENWVTWSSSDESVASVNKGVVTTYKAGTVVITASYGDLTTSATLNVTNVPVSGISIYYAPEWVMDGDSFYVNTMVYPENASDKRATATCLTPELATIECITSSTNYSQEPTFKITTMAPGEARFSIQLLEDPTKTVTFWVTILPVYIVDINIIKPENDTIDIYEPWQITDTEGVTITAPTGIDVRSNGEIMAYEPGIYTITLSKGTETVEYELIAGGEIIIGGLPSSNTIKIGERYESITAQSSFPAIGDIEWYSSDESIAEIYYDYVRGRNVLIGKKQGTVFIEAHMLGTSISAVIEINVVPQPVESVEIYQRNFVNGNTIYLGQTYSMAAKVFPVASPAATFDRVNWYDTNNLLTFTDTEQKLNVSLTAKTQNAKKQAETKIYAEAGGVYSEKLDITVKKPWATITNKPSNDTLYKGSTHTLSYTTDPENAEIKWDSSNDSVAAINSQTGEISARADGQVIISITVKYGDFIEVTDTFSLSVNNQSIWVDGYDSTELIIGDTVTLTAEVGTYDGDDKTVIWETSDSNIATVNNGVVTTIGVGEVTITARLKKYSNVFWPVTFDVKLPESTNVEITNTPKDNTLYVGDTHQLGYTITQFNALPDVEWNSSDESVAIIDPQTGEIEAKSVGSVTISIKVKYGNNAEITDSFTLDILSAGVVIDGNTKDVLTVGESISLKAAVSAGETANQAVEWKSDDTSIATVDQNGVVTAIAPGEVIISAKSKQYDYAINTVTFEVEPLLIYQTRNTELMWYGNNDLSIMEELRPDLLYYDLSKQEIVDGETVISENDFLNYVTTNHDGSVSYVPKTIQEYKNDLIHMGTFWFANDTFDPIITDMINHFTGDKTDNFTRVISEYNESTQSFAEYNAYENAYLTNEVISTNESNNFVDAIKTVFKKCLNENKNNITSLKYDVSTKKHYSEWVENKFVKTMTESKINIPCFNEYTFEGLTVCIDSLHGAKIEVVSYQTSGNSYNGKFKITYYDHFGLDDNDVSDGYDSFKDFAIEQVKGFRSWYILQRCNSFSATPLAKPFITVIEFEVPFSGNF